VHHELVHGRSQELQDRRTYNTMAKIKMLWTNNYTKHYTEN
jgi:hypothetical protein